MEEGRIGAWSSLERELGYTCLTADRWSHHHGFERSEPDGQGKRRSCQSTKCISVKRLSVLVGLHRDRRGPSSYTREEWRPSRDRGERKVKETIASPSFVLLKKYGIPHVRRQSHDPLTPVLCYHLTLRGNCSEL